MSNQMFDDAEKVVPEDVEEVVEGDVEVSPKYVSASAVDPKLLVPSEELKQYENESVDKKFEILSTRLDGFINHLAHQYAIPSRLDVEDIKQKLLINLVSRIESGKYANLNHIEAGFRTTGFMMVSDMIRFEKSTPRDFTKNESGDVFENEDGDESSRWELMAGKESEGMEVPDKSMSLQDIYNRIRVDLKGNQDAVNLFNLFVDPTPLKDIISKRREQSQKDFTEIPISIYQEYLNLHNCRFQEAYTMVKYIMVKWFETAPRPHQWRYNSGENLPLKWYLEDHNISSKAS